MNRSQNDAEFDGLALHDFLPLVWEASPLTDAAELEHYNQETARALQALVAVRGGAEGNLDAMPMPKGAGTAAPGGQGGRPAVAGHAARESAAGPAEAPQHRAARRHAGVDRALRRAGPNRGQRRHRHLSESHCCRCPFRLAGRVVSTVERGGAKWRLTRFEHLSPLVSVGLEKLVFRRHRRQVAIARGTDVFTQDRHPPGAKILTGGPAPARANPPTTPAPGVVDST